MLDVVKRCTWAIVDTCFFFQAEDGIRDLVRSRGLGDVYKRQGYRFSDRTPNVTQISGPIDDISQADIKGEKESHAVSYTHLTLPTSDLV
mgnify:CR=1 FL=1